jgi:glucosamine 6-phosphate synthetase-like amidotransferase/phosphosugar isomerase protein
MAKKVNGVKTVGVINTVGSALKRNVDCRIYTNVGREVAVGATKLFFSSDSAYARNYSEDN